MTHILMHALYGLVSHASIILRLSCLVFSIQIFGRRRRSSSNLVIVVVVKIVTISVKTTIFDIA